MQQAKTGDTVKIHYTGKLQETDKVFDTSRNSDPIEFQIGEGKLIPGFEKAVTGMNVGEKKTISLPPDEAYGQRREDLLVSVNRERFPEDVTPEVGKMLRIERPDGDTINVHVAKVEDDAVILDANHPLAGNTLVFDMELLEIV